MCHGVQPDTVRASSRHRSFQKSFQAPLRGAPSTGGRPGAEAPGYFQMVFRNAKGTTSSRARRPPKLLRLQPLRCFSNAGNRPG
jgi:hypothetical protein